jgi:hypothetical protein
LLPVCAKADCKENVSVINETQARIFVTATSVMLYVGRRNRDLALRYATPSQVIPGYVIDRALASLAHACSSMDGLRKRSFSTTLFIDREIAAHNKKGEELCGWLPLRSTHPPDAERP